jgi:DNA-binding CsgD family transcriptional regulator
MHPPIFVRELSGAERAPLEAGLRSASAFTMRRAQIVVLSAAGRRPREIAQGLCCAVQTVRNGIRAFNASGLKRRLVAAQELLLRRWMGRRWSSCAPPCTPRRALSATPGAHGRLAFWRR